MKKKTSAEMKLWRDNVKQYAIDIMGGSCKSCGYSKCNRALEFHHIDPTQKEYNFNFKNLGFPKLTDELRKCVLLCANCHREAHEFKVPYISSFDEEKSKIYLEKYRFFSYHKVDWEKVDLEKLRKQGLTNVAIGAMLGVSETMIRKKFASLVQW